MITKEQVMPLLLDACPSFTEKWQKHLAYWDGKNLLYNDLSEFNAHLFELHKNKQVEEFPEVFDVVEKLHLEGDDHVKEAATIGLLEGIQNAASHAEDFVQYLGTESEKRWFQLNDFWQGRIPSVGTVVDEKVK